MINDYESETRARWGTPMPIASTSKKQRTTQKRSGQRQTTA